MEQLLLFDLLVFSYGFKLQVDIMQMYAVISMQSGADWLQCVHVVFTARRVVGRVTVYAARTLVTQLLDAVTVSLATTAITVIDVCLSVCLSLSAIYCC